jgi:restriction system protein
MSRKPSQHNKGPEFLRFFGPVIHALKSLGGSGRPSEVEAIVVVEANISVPEQERVNKNGQSRISNQIAWARFYLSKAGYIESSMRGVWSLTPKGVQSELTKETALSVFRDVQQRYRGDANDGTTGGPCEEAALALDDVPVTDVRGYRDVLLDLMRSIPPQGFERLCQRLLRESGFEQVEVTGRSGDGGIDGFGVLQVNPLASFRVLFQCKRYTGSVPSKEVRDFRGTMAGRTDMGIMLTTGTFTAEARKEAGRDGVPRIELVDSEKLLAMFESLELGLKPTRTFVVDDAFFDEFR